MRWFPLVKNSDAYIMWIGLSIFSIFLALFGNPMAFALEVFSKDDKPFGIPYEDWIGKWWSWWISVPGNVEEGTIQGLEQDGCLMNNSSSMVMLMETAVGGKYHQNCEISSTQGIMIPLWTGWCDSGASGQSQYSYAQLTECARDSANLGIVKSSVKVDEAPLANLAVTSQDPGAGQIKYTKELFDNITETNSTKGFDLFIPDNTHFPGQAVGKTWRAGAHGWFVFLKPLPPGSHEISYATGVNENVDDPEGKGYGNYIQSKQNSEITYNLNVK